MGFAGELFALLPTFFILTVTAIGACRRVGVYDAFVEGAREGLRAAVDVLPYMAAMLSVIALFRASGGMDALERLIAPAFAWLGVPPEVAPLFVLRPFSGSASLAMLDEIFRTAGVDSAAGVVASVLMGSSETVFYTAGVYCAAAGVVRTRYIIPVSLATQGVALLASAWACAAVL